MASKFSAHQKRRAWSEHGTFFPPPLLERVRVFGV
jgi:hypothetical protein